MAIEGYREWALHHATMFALNGEHDKAMLISWEEIFEAQRFHVTELRAASHAMAKSPPRWRADHLTGIQEHVRAIRFEMVRAKQKEADAEEDKFRCPLCRGAGWAIVPHLKCVVDGEWINSYTSAVVCSCQRGSAVQTRIDQAALEWDQKKKPPAKPMKLLDYEMCMPNWQHLMIRRESQRQRERIALDRARGADKTFGEAVKKVLEKVAAVSRERGDYAN